MTGYRAMWRAVLFALILAGGGYGIGRSGQPGEADRPAVVGKGQGKPPVAVQVATATTGEMPVVLDALGQAEAYESVMLKSRIDGQVASVAYGDGQSVQAGEVLLRLDGADFEARLRQAEASLARDQAQWLKARADVSRYQALQAQGFVAEQKVEELRAVAAAAEATVQADRAAADLARLQLGYSVIRAPFAGVLGPRLVFAGTSVKANDTALALLNRVQPLFVTFSVPEKYLGALRSKLREGALGVSVKQPGENTALRAAVKFIDNTVDAATGTIRMKALLPNRDEALTPGQFLEVSLVLETLKAVVTVPVEAVQQGPEGAFVFVLGPDQRAAPRPVELAMTHHGQAALRAGLKAGEVVVTDGHSRLTPGAKVKIKAPGPATVPRS